MSVAIDIAENCGCSRNLGTAQFVGTLSLQRDKPPRQA